MMGPVDVDTCAVHRANGRLTQLDKLGHWLELSIAHDGTRCSSHLPANQRKLLRDVAAE
jgi:hypothetical protein